MKIHKNRIKRYLKIASWMLIDALRNYKKKIVVLVIAAIGSLFLQLSGLILAIKYISSLQANRDYEIWIIVLPYGDVSSVLLIGLLFIIFIFLSVSLAYFSRLSIIDMSVAYETLCLERVTTLMSSLSKPLTEQIEEHAFVRLTNSETRICGRALKVLLSGFLPLSILMVSFSVAFYLDFIVTLVAILLLSISFPLLYLNSLFGVSAIKSMEKISGRVSRYKSRLGKIVLEANGEINNRELFSVCDGQDDFNNFNQSFKNRFYCIERGRALTQIFSAIALCVFILYVGVSITNGGMPIAHLVGYFLALKYGVSNVISVISIVTGFNLFLPQLSRYYNFVKSFEYSKEKSGYEAAQFNDSVKATSYFSKKRAIFEVSFPLALALPDELSKLQISNLFTSMGLTRPYSIVISTQGSVDEKLAIQYLGLPEKYTIDDFLNDVEKWGVHESGEIRTAINRDEGIGRNIANIQSLSENYKFWISFLGAYYRGTDVLVVEEASLQNLPENMRNKIKRFLENKHVVYAYLAENIKYLKRSEMFLFWQEGPTLFYVSNQEYSDNRDKINKVIRSLEGQNNVAAVGSRDVILSELEADFI